MHNYYTIRAAGVPGQMAKEGIIVWDLIDFNNDGKVSLEEKVICVQLFEETFLARALHLMMNFKNL